MYRPVYGLSCSKHWRNEPIGCTGKQSLGDWDRAMEPVDGLVIIYARLRRPDLREEFWFHFENLLGERVTPTVYQLNIADWDDGLWQEEIEWIQGLFECTRESIVIWQFRSSGFDRYTVRGNA